MNLEAVIKRFFSDWQQFGMMGLGAFLINAGAGIIGSILMVVVMGPSLFSLFRAEAMGLGFGPGALFALFGSLFGVMIVFAIIGIVASGLSNAGVVGSVSGYRKGQPVSLGSFWQYATRYFGKMIGLGFLFGLIMMVSTLINIIPILGWIAFLLWLPVAAVALLLYPAHLIVSRNMGVGDALGVGFRLLTSQFKETFISGMLMLLIGIVLGIISWIPLVGWLVVAAFAQPFIIYFFAERFEHEVAPKLFNLPPAA